MQELCHQIYQALYTKVSLQVAGIVVGVFLVVVHAFALLKSNATKAALVKAPRNQALGMWLLTVSFVLAFVVATAVELGEFERMRWLAQSALPAMYVALLFYANDYLGARAAGILMLLAACPVLTAAKLKVATGHFLLPTVAYVWIILGLFWVGMPHVMRDQIKFATATEGRWKALCVAGVVYGLLLLGCASAFYGSAS